VVNPPQRNRTPNGAVTNFRVASTSRRYDKDVQGWVDNKTLFLDVECWGELGGNVSQTVSKGDPVIVSGSLFTDEWDTDQGRRSKVKLRAEVVGPDLTRGTADFKRALRAPATPADQGPPPADDEFDPTGELLAGRDYEADPETLDEMNSDTRVPEPALR
ncbi:MAG: single-stranded DNA-binding protein, partial [Ornithinibacter sp.]